MTLPYLLGFLLLIAVPAHALWRSFKSRPKRPRLVRYRATMIEAAVLLALLAAIAHFEDISAEALGLGLGLTTGGIIGLGIAAALVSGLLAITLLAKPKNSEKDLSEAAELMPQTRQEIAVFISLTLLIGFAWEILYRGFLLWWLTPMVGVVGAVLIAGVAYGLAHGWESPRQGVGSIVSALVFCTGYALTGSLWWLIAIHIALPLIGMFAMHRATKATGPSTAP